MPPQQQKHLWAGEFKFQQRVVCVQFQVQTKNEGKLVGIGVGEGIRRRHFPNPFRAPLQQPSHLFLGLRKQQSHSNNSFLSLSLSRFGFAIHWIWLWIRIFASTTSTPPSSDSKLPRKLLFSIAASRTTPSLSPPPLMD